jgi:hypothetical protein
MVEVVPPKRTRQSLEGTNKNEFKVFGKVEPKVDETRRVNP